ncbi:hypothetical protein [Roseisolibacter sp. H3M3-2]|uniref:hypothetical protein n=1 Tax=Roseisolibacter sp. H3M3-2 TaxID=3031323 RepID=UPI0023DA7971|nr:hypothetical protein [Roseisolibacter sp. H3M3-2]MDF1502999.1 hypothetical protein [Roseisolibacter sp. H3M3-2]
MGKPKHSDDPRGEQKGAQRHAEGQQGEKTREAFLAGISDHSRRGGGGDQDPQARGDNKEEHERRIDNPAANRDGGHRLFENRTQHDEAEKNSEKNRRDIDMRTHGHDPQEFQGRGGFTAHPQGGDQHHSASVRSVGQGGGNRSKEDRGGH